MTALLTMLGLLHPQNDAQQRSWAIDDDLHIIRENLKEFVRLVLVSLNLPHVQALHDASASKPPNPYGARGRFSVHLVLLPLFMRALVC